MWFLIFVGVCFFVGLIYWIAAGAVWAIGSACQFLSGEKPRRHGRKHTR